METFVKPRLRGLLHQWAAPVALGAGLTLVGLAKSLQAALAAGVFGLSLVTLFTVSATYHRVTWSTAARAWMRRADHASIFVLIAGSWTPIALLGLPPGVGTTLCAIIWGGAAIGVAISLFWVDAPKLVTAALCVALGWSLVPYFGVLRRSLTTPEWALLFGGGLAYTVGAVIYATRRFDFSPRTFGYHEVFHAFTLLGAAQHFGCVLCLVRGQ
ncbi:MAG TPA: hemolysin III family protein [Myxococcales bacterium]|jgi:hemolysin III|nr:hemolysin III family protein [Myxococcales bacterium]